jgi:hypothetical protein
MASRMADKVSDLGDRARERMMESRLDKFDRENDRLRSEVKLLRDDLQEERSSLERALDALNKRETVTVKTKPRRGRLLRTVVVGAGAYLLGTRAGRERYEQIMEKARSLTNRSHDGSTTSSTLS